MTDNKHKSPQVRQHHADQEGNTTINSIPRIQTHWGALCDEDLATVNGNVSFYRQLTRVSEIHELFVRYQSVF